MESKKKKFWAFVKLVNRYLIQKEKCHNSYFGSSRKSQYERNELVKLERALLAQMTEIKKEHPEQFSLEEFDHNLFEFLAR